MTQCVLYLKLSSLDEGKAPLSFLRTPVPRQIGVPDDGLLGEPRVQVKHYIYTLYEVHLKPERESEGINVNRVKNHTLMSTLGHYQHTPIMHCSESNTYNALWC